MTLLLEPALPVSGHGPNPNNSTLFSSDENITMLTTISATTIPSVNLDHSLKYSNSLASFLVNFTRHQLSTGLCTLEFGHATGLLHMAVILTACQG
jgi:hypothetical protein